MQINGVQQQIEVSFWNQSLFICLKKMFCINRTLDYEFFLLSNADEIW